MMMLYLLIAAGAGWLLHMAFVALRRALDNLE